VANSSEPSRSGAGAHSAPALLTSALEAGVTSSGADASSNSGGAGGGPGFGAGAPLQAASAAIAAHSSSTFMGPAR